MKSYIVRGSLFCLQCGLLNKPTPSSSSRFLCTVSSYLLQRCQQKNLSSFLRNYLQKRRVNTVETKREAKKLRNASFKDFKNIVSFAIPHKGRIFLALSFLGISSSIFLLTPRLLGSLIDEYDDKKKENSRKDDLTNKVVKYFKENPWAIIALLFIGATAICARVYLMHTAGQLVVNDLRTKVFGSVLQQDMFFFDRNKVGEIVSRLSTDALIVGYSVSINLSDGLRALVTCLGSGALMVYTSPTLCKVVVFVIPLIVGTFYVFGNLQRKYTIQMQEAVAGANQVATERLSNVRTVRMLVAENKEMNAYQEKIACIWTISKKEGLAKGLMFGGFQFAGYMSLTTILFYGSQLISQGLLTYGELSSFCLYSLFCAASLSNMSGFYTEMMKGLGASTRLFELESLKPTIPLTGGKVIKDVKKEICFNSVAFSYHEREPIFSDVTFTMPAGKITAIVGASGSGKSTIANLLLRLYNPDKGRITVDGIDLQELDPSKWRRIIGTVGQEPVLFFTTIKKNITYGAEFPEKITEEEIMEAAEQANCLEFIQTFPRGFNTIVGESNASMLSGGQKQRIAIARALVTKPRMLILDEATSALDATSEYLVRTALNRLLANNKQTVLIIAHRLSTIKHADQIVVLNCGKVGEIGTFGELMQIPNGIFKRLVEKQTIGWDNDNF